MSSRNLPKRGTYPASDAAASPEVCTCSCSCSCAAPIQLVSLKQLLAELGDDEETPLPKSTYYDWDAKGKAPKGFRLPNGRLRFRRSEVNRWIEQREAAS